jgi:nucleoside-diphosphate-sugar epimerase
MTDIKIETPTLLLTGATGWLGQRMALAATGGLNDCAVPAVLAGRVRALVSPGQRFKDLLDRGIDVVQGDLRDPEAIASFVQGAADGILIHLAGVIHPLGRTEPFDAVNHRATLALHDAARAVGVRRMVVMSSNSPIGANATPSDRFDEASPYNPYMGYGRSKMLMEQGLRARMADGKTPEVVIIRAPWFYGPGQPPRQSLFFKMVRMGRFPIFGDGRNRRSMSYVDNLVQGLLLAVARPQAAQKIYWIADEQPYAMRDIVGTVKEVLRDFGMQVKDAQPPRLPGLIPDLARVTDRALQRIGLYHQKIHVLSEMNLTIACDVDVAKRDLGYVPTVALREGMRRSVAWCVEHGHDL